MLDGKIAIITGGSAGIGKAIAAEYVEQGAEVVIASRGEERGTAVAEELGCEFRQCDVREYDQVEALVEGVVDDYGGLNVMVNDAGIGSTSSLPEMELEEWRDVLDTNLDGVMHGSKAALPHLLESAGCIVNVESIYGLRGGKGARHIRRRKAVSSTSPSKWQSTTPVRASGSTASARVSSRHR